MGLGSWFQETVSRPVRRTAGLPVQSDVPGAPEPIDVNAAAKAQADANRFNINSPFGGVRWSQDASGKWTQTISPNAAQARAMSSIEQMQPLTAQRIYAPQMTAAAQQRAPSAFQTQGPRGSYGVNAPNVEQWRGDSAGQIPNAPQAGMVPQWRHPNMGAMPSAPTAGQLPSAPGAGQVAQFAPQAQTGEDAQRATFERAMAMFQPQFQKQQRQLDQQLANQGLPMGSEAFADRQSNLAEGQSKAMTDAALAAVLAGNDEAARRAQIEMAQYQNVLAGQGQQFGQDMGAYNAALVGQGQGFNQQLGSFDASLRGRGQQFGEALSGYNAQLAGQGQQFGQQLGAFDAALRGQGQQFGQDVASYQTGLQGQNQAFQQALARTGQMFGQDLAAAQFGRQGELDLYDRSNQANQQNFSNELSRLQSMFGMNAQAQQQNFSQDLQAREAQRALAAQLLGYMPGVQQVPIDVLGPMQGNQALQQALHLAGLQRQTDQTTAMWNAIGSIAGGGR